MSEPVFLGDAVMLRRAADQLDLSRERRNRVEASMAGLLRAVAAHMEQGWTAPGGGIALRATAVAEAVLGHE